MSVTDDNHGSISTVYYTCGSGTRNSVVTLKGMMSKIFLPFDMKNSTPHEQNLI